MSDGRSVVLVAPITPAASGNGLAMRAGMLLEALAPVAAVHVVIVPLSGPADDTAWAAARARSLTVVGPVTGAAAAREHVTMQLADPELRERLQRVAPLPVRATLAPPTLAPAVAASLPDDVTPPDVVLALRLYLAPLGAWLRRELAAGSMVVDADDDDAALLRSLGDADEADAFERLARGWLPDADTVFAASRPAAAALAANAGLHDVGVVPNAVALPAVRVPAPGNDRILFLGNLTYEPNRIAARRLVHEILPAVRRSRPRATLDLVGRHAGTLDDLAACDGVRLAGAVPDVTPWYASADVVVVPLQHGSGTRIKVLEAFAHGRPVVATPAAVAGLDLDRGRADPGPTALIAESSADLAQAVVGLLGNSRDSMTERAARLVADRYSPAAVAPLVRGAVLGHPGEDLRARAAPGGSAAA